MPSRFYLCLLVGLAGCGSTIGALDSLPSGPDVSDAEWPLLIDTPEPPEERLTAGTGGNAVERLSARRTQAGQRLSRAESVPPVSDTLLARGTESQSRSAVASVPAVDEADLLARADLLRQRSQIEVASVNETDLQARAELNRTRTSLPIPASTVTTSLDAAGPRVPVPLRALDTPVVSSSFEERARRAQERAKRAGS